MFGLNLFRPSLFALKNENAFGGASGGTGGKKEVLDFVLDKKGNLALDTIVQLTEKDAAECLRLALSKYAIAVVESTFLAGKLANDKGQLTLYEKNILVAKLTRQDAGRHRHKRT